MGSGRRELGRWEAEMERRNQDGRCRVKEGGGRVRVGQKLG